jgi:hypothetical protein
LYPSTGVAPKAAVVRKQSRTMYGRRACGRRSLTYSKYLGDGECGWCQLSFSPRRGNKRR